MDGAEVQSSLVEMSTHEGSHNVTRPVADNAGTSDYLLSLGFRLRSIRHAQGLTLQGLSELTGLSSSMISLVERGRASPSIGSLIAISAALHVPLKDFFDQDSWPSSGIVKRADDQPVISLEPGVERRLVTTDPGRNIQISMNVYEPGLRPEPQPARHSGYEYGLVLAGQLSVEVAGVNYVLAPGDVISYESSQLHFLHNAGTEQARALWINIGSL